MSRYKHRVSAEWTDCRKVKRWLQIEATATRAWSDTQQLTADESATALRLCAHLSAMRADKRMMRLIDREEQKCNHDFEAFLRVVLDRHQEFSGALHRGLTSSDVIDTGMYLAAANSTAMLVSRIGGLLSVLNKMPRDTPMIARTHGQRARQATSGHYLSAIEEQIKEIHCELDNCVSGLRIGKLRGPTGHDPLFPPEAEAYAMRLLGLDVAPVSTQVLPRRRLTRCLASIEELMLLVRKLANDMRLLLIDGLGAAKMKRSELYVGSSSMPHKNNPTEFERACGLCTTVIGQCRTVRDVSSSLWLYRDISNSSAERTLLPQIFTLACFVVDDVAKALVFIEFCPQVFRSSHDIFNAATGSGSSRESARISAAEDDQEPTLYDVQYATDDH